MREPRASSRPLPSAAGHPPFPSLRHLNCSRSKSWPEHSSSIPRRCTAWCARGWCRRCASGRKLFVSTRHRSEQCSRCRDLFAHFPKSDRRRPRRSLSSAWTTCEPPNDGSRRRPIWRWSALRSGFFQARTSPRWPMTGKPGERRRPVRHGDPAPRFHHNPQSRGPLPVPLDPCQAGSSSGLHRRADGLGVLLGAHPLGRPHHKVLKEIRRHLAVFPVIGPKETPSRMRWRPSRGCGGSSDRRSTTSCLPTPGWTTTSPRSTPSTLATSGSLAFHSVSSFRK